MDQDACAAAADVETGDQSTQFVEPGQGLGAWVGVSVTRLGTELHPRRGLAVVAVTGLIDAQQCRSGVDLSVDRGEYLTHASRVRRAHGSFHLHGFEHDEGVPGFDLVADGDRQGDDDGGSRGADQTGFVLADPVADAVDLDEEAGGAGDGDDLVAAVTEDQPALVSPRRSTSTTVRRHLRRCCSGAGRSGRP